MAVVHALSVTHPAIECMGTMSSRMLKRSSPIVCHPIFDWSLEHNPVYCGLGIWARVRPELFRAIWRVLKGSRTMERHTHATLARLAFAALALTAAVGLLVAMGPLNPPAGPVTSTYKTLTEVEPRIAINLTNTPGDADSLFKITQPGSYYLAGNITGVAGKHGIEIVASGVTLDLKGFDLSGVPAMGAFDGVSVTVTTLRDIAVANGSVRNWGDEGIDLGTSLAANCRVEGVNASGNTGNGISVGSGTTVSNCSASSNSSSGISTGNGCSITNCAINLNTVNGINASSTCSITNCSAFDNTGHGIGISDGSTVSNCAASFNTLSGIGPRTNVLLTGSTIADCAVRGNTGDGILFASNCIVRGNTCAGNGNGGDGAGIHATGADNRIEGNNCSGGDRGIDVGAAGNIIIKNTCSGATLNWTIAANNVCGPILDRTAPASAAISGNSAPSSLATTDPHANFSY